MTCSHCPGLMKSSLSSWNWNWILTGQPFSWIFKRNIIFPGFWGEKQMILVKFFHWGAGKAREAWKNGSSSFQCWDQQWRQAWDKSMRTCLFLQMHRSAFLCSGAEWHFFRKWENHLCGVNTHKQSHIHTHTHTHTEAIGGRRDGTTDLNFHARKAATTAIITTTIVRATTPPINARESAKRKGIDQWACLGLLRNAVSDLSHLAPNKIEHCFPPSSCSFALEPVLVSCWLFLPVAVVIVVVVVSAGVVVVVVGGGTSVLVLCWHSAGCAPTERKTDRVLRWTLKRWRPFHHPFLFPLSFHFFPSILWQGVIANQSRNRPLPLACKNLTLRVLIWPILTVPGMLFCLEHVTVSDTGLFVTDDLPVKHKENQGFFSVTNWTKQLTFQSWGDRTATLKKCHSRFWKRMSLTHPHLGFLSRTCLLHSLVLSCSSSKDFLLW